MQKREREELTNEKRCEGLERHHQKMQLESKKEDISETNDLDDGRSAEKIQAGLVDEDCNFFDSMCKEHGIEARMEHYACMVLLGHVGRLEEAYNMIEVHGNVSIGEAAAKHLFELEPTNCGNYILLSNIYASKSMWTEVDAVTDMMKAMGLRKSRG
ncbi:pentatricopeptide repeat-containing protein At1g20230-like [Pistacia vera]|uniref:pentatricopeptide repeat-containing protein At1g20230-like n=1 Tax=Pistacia vera TaxID=55513 RepID=UPI0012630B5A|nr:pentatricopeptide repeat-containing protein At1g20230-like [Pistacia vera]